MLQILGLALLFVSVAQGAIFGRDDRVAISPTSIGSSLAQRTAIAILSTNLETTSQGKFNLKADSLTGVLCPRERFVQDPSLPYSCTGFLVGPDLIATAGHCMVNAGESEHETGGYCQVYSWLFDYQIDRDGKVDLENIPEEKLYRCKQVVFAVHEEKPPYRDFSLVQLVRPVSNREPLRLSADPIPMRGLSMIGYPLGTPAKFSGGAEVLKNDLLRQSFITNLDAFEGNSGSPVFNAASEVVGILIGGTPVGSLVDAGSGASCRIFNRCDEAGKNCLEDQGSSAIDGFQATGSEVQRIAPLKALVEKFNRNR